MAEKPFTPEEISAFGDIQKLTPNEQQKVLQHAEKEDPEFLHSFDRYLSFQHAQSTGKGLIPDNTVQEQHPAIGNLERAKLENLSTSPEATLETLKANHPELEYATQPALKSAPNQVYMHTKGTTEPWKVLNPQTGIDIGPELLKDLSGKAFPAAKAAAELAGQVGGGVGGAALTAETGPLGMATGSLLGSSLGGGAASAGMASLQQALGHYFGVKQPAVDIHNTSKEGLQGMLSGALLGGGATPGKSLLPDAISRLPTAGAQGGLLGLASEGAGKTLGAMTSGAGALLSGYPRKEITQAITLLPKIKMLESGGDVAAQSAINDLKSTVTDAAISQRQKIGGELAQAMEQAGMRVDVTPILKRFEDKATEILGREHFGKLDEKELADLMATRGEFLSSKRLPDGELPTSLSATDAWRTKRDMGDFADLRKGPDNYKGLDNRSKSLQRLVTSAWQDLDKGIAQATEGVPALNARYRQLSEIEKVLKPFFSRSESETAPVEGLLQQIGSPSAKGRQTRGAINALDPETGQAITENAQLFHSARLFSKDNVTPLSGMGTTGTQRGNNAARIGGALGGAAGAYLGKETGIGPYAGGAMGALAGHAIAGPLAAPAAMRNYMDIGQVIRDLANKVPEKVQSPFGRNLFIPQILGRQYAIPSAWEGMSQ